MRTINAQSIKVRMEELGADLCGIAPVERFNDAPAGFHPVDVTPGCRSVIVIASRFPGSTLTSPSPAAYTFVRNQLVNKIDTITFQVAMELENLGCKAVPIPSSDPYDYWDDTRMHGMGILSLKHAAVRAGLGHMGKNTLLVNDRFGNMIWLGAVLVDQDIEPDTVAAYQTCPSNCRICIDSCPANALDGMTIQQNRCRPVSAKSTPGGGGVYACNLCRKICPHHQGIK